MVVGYTFHGGDLFHAGHLYQLRQCKEHCDYLIVGILTDRALRSYKREPIIPYPWRAIIYEELRCVDRVVPQNGRDPTENLQWLHPDILFHGDDWEDLPGEKWMEAHGGKTIKTAYFGPLSTTRIIEAILRAWKEHEA